MGLKTPHITISIGKGGRKMDCPHYQYRSGDYYCDLCQNCVNEAKHDNYCTDYNGTNYDKCDIYKKYG